MCNTEETFKKAISSKNTVNCESITDNLRKQDCISQIVDIKIKESHNVKDCDIFSKDDIIRKQDCIYKATL
jgi:hypothetical protein